MKPHLVIPRAFHLVGRDHRSGTRVYRFIVDRFLLLPLGALLALVWANTAAESYFRFSNAMAFPVNEIAMTLFLALLAQDVLEGVMPGGALHRWRHWSLPLVAAAGGIVGSVGVYLAYVTLGHETVLRGAWPIACVIDIAAGYYVLKTIARRSSMLPFLVLLAAATDAFGLLVAAVWPRFVERSPASPLLVIAALGLALLFKRCGVRAFWPYLTICGPLSWAGLYWAGIHPALALVPLVPFLPHEPRRKEVFAEPAADDAVHRTEREWHEMVQLVLFFFGLVNAGEVLRGYDTGTWAVLTAGLVGRPAGILLATALAVAVGLRLPRDIGWREVIVVALATTSGFTFALFFATGLLPLGAVLTQIKVGALLTTSGALVTLGLARCLRVGRFG